MVWGRLVQPGVRGVSRLRPLSRVCSRGQNASLNVYFEKFGKQTDVQWRGMGTTTVTPIDGVYKSPYPDIDIPKVPLAHYVLEHITKHGDRVALINGYTGQQTTYSQLHSQIIKVASAFKRLGLQQGHVVKIFSPNCPEFVVTYLGVIAAGGVVSAINPLYTSGELAHSLNEADAQYVATIPMLLPVAQEALKSCPNVKEIIIFGEADNCRPLSQLLEDDGSLFPERLDIDVEDSLAALPFSSGTTGLPKGVMLTHYNIVSNVEQLSTEYMRIKGPHECFMGVLPFFHIYGQVVSMLLGLVEGATIVTVPRFEPDKYLQLLQDHKCSLVHLVPPMMLFLAKHPMVAKYDFSSVEEILVGSAPLSGQVIEEALQKMKNPNIRVRQAYGLTESSPVTHANPMKDYRYESIGLPIHNVHHKIVHIETGEALGPKEQGELCVRGPNVMKGYLKNPEATANTIKDGWLHTGDIAYTDTDGHVVITDRLKELIKYKGFQVAPAELEALLLTHPAVQDSAVIGIPDDKAGEIPRAYVVLKADHKVSPEEIKDFIKGQVAPFKQLAGGVIFRDEIPKSLSGKILRRQLKDEVLGQK